jgi:dihydroorotate dehydrogenase electron transfer subunit
MNVLDCEIISKEILSENKVILGLKSFEISHSCKSGQFVQITCGDALLRRPFSICGIDTNKGIFYIGIGVRGKGTSWLFERKTGETLSVLGPLGSHFIIPESKKCVVIGGGIGVFPLMFLLQEIRLTRNQTIAVCGYKSAADAVCTDQFKKLANQVLFVSECGDMDLCGNAAMALNGLDLSDSQIFTCGPIPMMKAVSEIAYNRGIPCQVSLEERMGCGTGICLVCACKIKSDRDEEGYEYQRCCKEGPVFNSAEVIWESM